MEKNLTAIIDIGTYSTKAGFSGESEPAFFIPSIIGKPRPSTFRQNTFQQDIYIGNDAIKNLSILSLSSPLNNRILQNMDETQAFLEYLFSSQFKIPSTKLPVLLSIDPFTEDKDREKLTTLLFETFHTPLFYGALSSSLILYSSGLITGFSIDIGEMGGTFVPIYEGFSMCHLSKKMDIGGKHVSNCLRKAVIDSGYSFPPLNEKDIIRDIKEQLCYVQVDTSSKPEEKVFLTPENQSIKLTDQLFKSTEPLFNPNTIGINAPGMSELIYESMTSIDSDVKDSILKNVVIAGGTSLLPGLPQRIEKDISDKMLSISTIAPPGRKTSLWIGGSMIASIPTFKDLSISKAEYEESGPSIIHIKSY